MFEAFVKSNRVALAWAVPVGAALSLFADDIVRYAFGARWAPAGELLAVIGVTAAIGHVAFNWAVFFRAVGNTRPLFAGAVVDLVVFAAVGLPAIITLGLTGWAVSVAAQMVAQLAVRAFYLRSLFPQFSLLGQLARALLPTVPAAALVLATRALAPGDDSLVRSIGELLAFTAVAAALTILVERALLREMLGLLWRRAAVPAAPPPAPDPISPASPS